MGSCRNLKLRLPNVTVEILNQKPQVPEILPTRDGDPNTTVAGILQQYTAIAEQS